MILIFSVVLLYTLACNSTDAKMSEELSDAIKGDLRFEQVEEMAEKLVEDGLTAGDSYGEVWIRDLNSFIELAVAVNGKERSAEALLTFLGFRALMEIFRMVTSLLKLVMGDISISFLIWLQNIKLIRIP